MSQNYSFEEKINNLGIEYYIHLTIIQNGGRELWYNMDHVSVENPSNNEQSDNPKIRINRSLPDLVIDGDYKGGLTISKNQIDFENIDEKQFGELLGYISPVNDLCKLSQTSEKKFGGSVSVKMKNGKFINIFTEWCFIDNPQDLDKKYKNRVYKIEESLKKDNNLWKLIDNVSGGCGPPVFHNINYYITKLNSKDKFTKEEDSEIRNYFIGSH